MVKINLIELFQYLESNKLPSLGDGKTPIFWAGEFRSMLERYRLDHPKEPEINLVPQFGDLNDEAPITRLSSGDIQVYYKDGAWYSPTPLDLPDFHFFKTHHTCDHDEKIRFGGAISRFENTDKLKPVDGVYYLYTFNGDSINIYKDDKGYYTTRHQLSHVGTETIMRLISDPVVDEFRLPIVLKPLEDNSLVFNCAITLLEEAGTIVNQDLYKLIERIVDGLLDTDMVKTFELYQVGHRYIPKPRLFINIPSMPNYSVSCKNTFNIIEIINHTTNESLRLVRHSEVKLFETSLGKGLPDLCVMKG
jgi:hypothetical protein